MRSARLSLIEQPTLVSTRRRTAEAVDLLLDVLATWADHPGKHTTEWAEAFKPSVRALEELSESYQGRQAATGFPA